MIKYKKKITINRHNSGDWYIDTDRGDRYECFSIENTNTPWTRWWEMQDQSELRLWQKDIIRTFASKINDLKPFVVYKRNHGHNQPHDIMLARSESLEIWLLASQNDFWFTKSNYGQIEFLVNDSLGSVLNRDSREQMYILYDAL